MKKSLIISIVLFFFTGLFYAQKREIGAQDYRSWKKLSSSKLSKDASLIGYQAAPIEGDGVLYLYQNTNGQLDSFSRGEGLYFSADNSLAVFKIKPGFDTLRALKFEKVKKSKWPLDTLCIIDLKTNKTVEIPNLKKYTLSKNGNTLCYLTRQTTSKKKGWMASFSKPKKGKNTDVLRVYTSYPNLFLELNDVVDFKLSIDGNRLGVLHKAIVNKEVSYNVKVYDLRSINPVREFDAAEKFQLSGWSKSGDKFAFFQLSDSSLKNHELHVYNLKSNKSTLIGPSLLADLFGDSLPSVHQRPLFSKNEDFMVFGLTKTLIKEPEDSLMDEERFSVDIWHYLDKKIQPQQLKDLKRLKKKSDWFVFSFKDSELKKLNNDTLQLRFNDEFESMYHLSYSNESYAVASQWSYPWPKDVYRVDLKTAEHKLLLEQVRYGGELSPDGSIYTFFNPEQGQRMALRIPSMDTLCLTCEIDAIKWSRDKNGLPALAGPLESYGFSRSMRYYFQSERDIWYYDFLADTLVCLSHLEGNSRNIKLSLRKKHSDSSYVDVLDTYVTGFNKSNKGMHVFSWLQHENHLDLVENLNSPHRLIELKWSDNGEKTLLRRSSVQEYPDLYLSDSKFKSFQRLSQINPQQKELKWPTVDLMSWMSYDSIALEGLVYLPESYDTTRKYPMLIYYYELNSDNLHRYRSPRPSASIINPVECASKDYIVFVPDIRYKEGYPARSAYDAVMSGTDFMLKNYAIDSTKMGLQGQSWGGYQTAQLITMTKRYAAAMAGAPVSNMFSAYGGIRWGSGINRQFQYEATQSRIGKTIWEAPELYYENSPIFHLPKVETPLLIMHNDADGAVPWYQGIEMYNGMRRLEKPCWMLVYNKDGHNLRKLPNKFDLSIRMNQFFDHYLKEEPMPIWMRHGIPAIQKGMNNGYGFDER